MGQLFCFSEEYTLSEALDPPAGIMDDAKLYSEHPEHF